jgi:hypothetical protein
MDHPKIAHLRSTIGTLLAERRPFLAVCLSHQVLSMALGLALIRRDVPNHPHRLDRRIKGHQLPARRHTRPRHLPGSRPGHHHDHVVTAERRTDASRRGLGPKAVPLHPARRHPGRRVRGAALDRLPRAHRRGRSGRRHPDPPLRDDDPRPSKGYRKTPRSFRHWPNTTGSTSPAPDTSPVSACTPPWPSPATSLSAKQSPCPDQDRVTRNRDRLPAPGD